MFTLLMPNRSHLVSDEDAARIVDALKEGRAVETIGIEFNGAGSGDWEVTINVAQVVALVRHRDGTGAPSQERERALRLIPSG